MRFGLIVRRFALAYDYRFASEVIRSRNWHYFIIELGYYLILELEGLKDKTPSLVKAMGFCNGVCFECDGVRIFLPESRIDGVQFFRSRTQRIFLHGI